MTKQEQLLTHSLTFPMVLEVVYCTRSVYPEENELLVTRVLKKSDTHPKLPPFRLKSPAPSVVFGSESSGIREKFFRLEPSQHSNGCFISLLAREADSVPVLSVRDVLARAAAKGLMTGILPNQQSAPKKKKHRKNRPPAHTDQSLHKSQLKASLPKKKLVIGKDPGSSATVLVKSLALIGKLSNQEETDDKAMKEGQEEEGEDGEYDEEKEETEEGVQGMRTKLRRGKAKHHPQGSRKRPAKGRQHPHRDIIERTIKGQTFRTGTVGTKTGENRTARGTAKPLTVKTKPQPAVPKPIPDPHPSKSTTRTPPHHIYNQNPTTSITRTPPHL
uniref:SAM-dependent MTase RsmB/NOP-type domain-containing protein n=2 Tax=Esox lucius TaxID=8010 RepID=A0AAY5K1E2_ESOLU